MSVVGVVVVGGSGGLVALAGVPMVLWSVRTLLGADVVDRVVVLAFEDVHDEAARTCVDLPVAVLPTGVDRSESIRRALCPVRAHVRQRADTVAGDGLVTTILLHDATRPLAPAALAAAVVAAVRSGHRVAVPVLPLSDTVKQVDATGRLLATPARAGLRVVQTPQAVAADLLDGPLLDALAGGAVDVVPAVGVPVHTVPGHPQAFAVSTAWDLELAEMLVGAAPWAGTGL